MGISDAIWIVASGAGLILVLLADRSQSMKFREISKKIAADPGYLTFERREWASQLMSMVVYSGPFTLREVRKLRKALSQKK